MNIKTITTSDAQGCYLGRTIRHDGLVLRRGRKLDEDDICRLQNKNICHIDILKITENDVLEDEAANILAADLVAEGTYLTDSLRGRVNVHAAHAGLFSVDPTIVTKIHKLDAITLATGRNMTTVNAGILLASLKIVPFMISKDMLEAVKRDIEPALRVFPWALKKISMVATTFSDEKSQRIQSKFLETTSTRLRQRGVQDILKHQILHEPSMVQEILARLPSDSPVLFLGAEASMENDDLLPSLPHVTWTRAGIPTDPGNLMWVGKDHSVVGTPRDIIIVPGCARSLEHNGFDDVLDLLCSGHSLTRDRLDALAVGGLYKTTNIFSERGLQQQEYSLRSIILAAGKGERFQNGPKPLAPWGQQTFVQQVHDLARPYQPLLVTRPDLVNSITSLLPNTQILSNQDWKNGISSSLKSGLAEIEDDQDIIVFLCDMPAIRPETIAMLVQCYQQSDGSRAFAPRYRGTRGHPVIIPRSMFSIIKETNGDIGLGPLLKEGINLCTVHVDDPGVVWDIDTNDDWTLIHGKMHP